MACPFFYPRAKQDDGTFVIPPRLPLGDLYSGECHAQTHPYAPPSAYLSRFCNAGYGRGSCERFPQDAEADAVRFHITPSQENTLRVQYVLERGCWPAGHGTLEYSESTGQFAQQHSDRLIQRQAEACVESYLRRRP